MTAPMAETEDDWGNFSSNSFSCDEKKEDCFSDDYFNSFGNGITQGLNNCTTLNVAENYGSMEDLVKKFEQKISKCFKIQNKSINNDKIVKPLQTLNDILDYNDIWKSITDNYGLVKPLDWCSSQIRKLHIPALDLNISDQSNVEKDLDGYSEFESNELKNQMDFHKLIEYNVYSECEPYQMSCQNSETTGNGKLQSADEVIQELEEIMLDADEQDAAFDDELEQQTGIIIADTDGSIDAFSIENDLMSDESSIIYGRNLGSPSSQEESDRASSLKQMSIAELNEELCSLESTVKFLSEDLLNQLNFRDELLYEKEVRNTFISKILEVQRKQEQFQQNDKAHSSRFKFGKLSKSFSMSNASVSSSPGRFLTTVIPFDEGGVPPLEGLQALIKLLDAIKADSEEVPSLITNYILKVLVPAPTSARTLTL
uniref:fasciculation and elongation protein zeta-2-like n=1 Tax=Styela clava TaxID=7725 RepID=UPI001939E398|nr:fasciculation and elongation protein zeta-2-like [Styela clava]